MTISQTVPVRSGVACLCSACPVMWKLWLVLTVLLVAGRGQAVGGLSMNYDMEEEAGEGTILGNVLQDTGLGNTFNASIIAQLHFSILKGAYAKYFTIREGSHDLVTSDTILDRDTVCPKQATCLMQIDLAVSRPISLFRVIKTFITVIDKNDNHPSFPETEYRVEVSENANPGIPFTLPVASDPDSEDFGKVQYELIGSSVFSLSVTPNDFGEPEVLLILEEKVDREAQQHYSLELKATDGGQPPLSGTLEISVVITDTNDNHPVFEQHLYNTSVPENYPLATPILKVQATDMDHGENAAIQYSLSRQTAASSRGIFEVDPKTGDLYLLQNLDYEEQQVHQLTITARDKGHGSVPSNARVLVYVRDVNDVTPRITVNVLTSSGQAQVTENLPPGQFVAHVSVEDPDGGPSGDVTCNVSTSNMFSIIELTSNEFKLMTNASFDRELQDTVNVGILCSDNGRPSLSTVETLTVTILDENDNPPIFTQTNYTTTVRENSSFPVPIFYVSASDEDSGDNALVTYHFGSSDTSYLIVDSMTGLVSTNMRLDRESNEQFTVIIYAIDNGNPRHTGTSLIRVILDDINDEGPVFTKDTYVFGTFENQLIGTEIGSVIATDADTGPRKEVLYTLASTSQSRNIFRVDAQSGKISTKRMLDREQKDMYTITVMGTNTMQPYFSATTTVNIHVADKNDNAPQISYPRTNNNTVHISAYAKKSSHVTRILAKDADLGKNALLAYQIGQGNNADIFALNPASGELILERTLNGNENPNQTLLIVVQDQGNPTKSSVAQLTVILDHNIGVAAGDSSMIGEDTREDGLTMELTIVIIVGCLSVVLAGCLAALLVYLCRRKPDSPKRLQPVKSDNNPGMYSGIRKSPEDGMEEVNTTPLTALALGDLDQATSLSQVDIEDIWITDEPQKIDENLHLDSGHGSWAESGSDCGTVTLEHGDAAGMRSYFRRPVLPDGQEYTYRAPTDMYGGTVPRLPVHYNIRQKGSGNHLYNMYMRPPSLSSPSYSDTYTPMVAEPSTPQSPTGTGHRYLRPPLPPPRRTPTPIYVSDPSSPQGHKVCYSMEDLIKLGNKINIVKNQFGIPEPEPDNTGRAPSSSVYTSGSGSMPPQTLKLNSMGKPKPLPPVRGQSSSNHSSPARKFELSSPDSLPEESSPVTNVSTLSPDEVLTAHDIDTHSEPSDVFDDNVAVSDC